MAVLKSNDLPVDSETSLKRMLILACIASLVGDGVGLGEGGFLRLCLSLSFLGVVGSSGPRDGLEAALAD